MRGFPLNELLAASDMDKIRDVIVAIFSNMKKLSTRYGCSDFRRSLSATEALLSHMQRVPPREGSGLCPCDIAQHY